MNNSIGLFFPQVTKKKNKKMTKNTQKYVTVNLKTLTTAKKSRISYF